VVNKPEGAGESLSVAEKRMDDARDLLRLAMEVKEPMVSAHALNLLVGRAEEWLTRLREFREAEGRGG